MKVIKQGKEWTKRINCKGCEAILEIEESDLQHKVTASDAAKYQYEEDVKGTYFVECGHCGEPIDLKTKDIPARIAEKVRNK